MTDKAARHFEVSEDELLILADALMTRLLDIEVHEFLTGWGGGTNEHQRAALDYRLEEIRAAVGDEAMAEVRANVEDRFRHQLGERYWHIFTHGSQEEKDKVAEEWEQGHRPIDDPEASPSKSTKKIMMTTKKWKKKMIGLTASNGDRLWQMLVRKKDWKANPDPASYFPSRYFPPESSEFQVDGVVELCIRANALSGDSFYPTEWVYRGSDL